MGSETTKFWNRFSFLCDGIAFEEIGKLQPKFNKTRRQKFGRNGTIALTELKVVRHVDKNLSKKVCILLKFKNKFENLLVSSKKIRWFFVQSGQVFF